MTLSVSLVALPSAGRAQERGTPVRLTEAEAVRRSLSRPALADAIDGAVGVARADRIAAGLWPNPTISWAHEQTLGEAEGTGEDAVWVSQSLELSGRRGLLDDAGALQVRAARQQGRATRRDVVAEVRRRFHEVLGLQGRVAVVEQWARRIEAVGGLVARREAAGDASAYDRQRLDRERLGARARLQVEQAELARARGRLAALVGGEVSAPLVVSGTLLPDAPSEALAALLSRSRSAPELRALEAEAAAADLAGRAAGRWWVPELTLAGGYRRVDLGPRHADGFVATASLVLPLLDRNQDDETRAIAEGRLARARRRLAGDEAAAEVRGLWALASGLHAAARTFRAEAVQASSELVATAEAAYRGGELGILELVDAYAGALEAELRAVDLETDARRARIELDRLTSGGPR